EALALRAGLLLGGDVLKRHDRVFDRAVRRAHGRAPARPRDPPVADDDFHVVDLRGLAPKRAHGRRLLGRIEVVPTLPVKVVYCREILDGDAGERVAHDDLSGRAVDVGHRAVRLHDEDADGERLEPLDALGLARANGDLRPPTLAVLPLERL